MKSIHTLGFDYGYYSILLFLFSQALGEDSASWNKTAAINWIKVRQNSDGSFNDIPTTANVIMALYDKGIGSVKDIDCDEREDLGETDVCKLIIDFMKLSENNFE